jgi:hypothetical protein
MNGKFLFAKLSRRLKGDWYGGVLTRIIDANQSINTTTVDASSEFDIGDVTSEGLGAILEYDSSDNPFNSSDGRYFKLDALFNDEVIGSSST